MNRNRTIIAISALAAVSAIFAAWFQTNYAQPPLQKFKQLPDFELVSQSGSPVRLADLKGRVWLADFIYTTCPATCPMLSSRLSKLQERALKNDAVRFVSISVNPGHDTPETLRQYADRFHALPGKWLFLTGEKSKVGALVNGGFMLTAGEKPQSNNEEMVHSTKLALVDKDGVVRAYYDGMQETEADHILHDIKRLIKE